MAGLNVPGLLALLLVLAVVLSPILLGRFATRDDSDDEPDGGGGGGGSPVPRAPIPGGGIPLPDADSSRARLREHGRLADARSRPARRPGERPRRTHVRH